jgi:hypothetical protein
MADVVLGDAAGALAAAAAATRRARAFDILPV